MFKILVAISSTPQNDYLISTIRRFRAEIRLPCEIELLHVVPLSSIGEGSGELVTREMEDCKARLEAFEAEYPGEFKTRLEMGEPGPVICKAAHGFDLVVVGSHRRTAISEFLLGSTSSYVSHHAPCAVLIQRPKKP